MKAKKKFNRFDIAVALVAVLLVIAAAYKFMNLRPAAASASTPVTYTVKVSGVLPYSGEAYQVGDSCFTTKGMIACGTITDVEVETAYLVVKDEDGTALKAESERLVDVTLTIAADAVQSGSRWQVNSFNLMVGKVMDVTTKYATCEGEILSVMVQE